MARDDSFPYCNLHLLFINIADTYVDLIHVMGIQNEENSSWGCEEKAGSITCDSISISILCNSYVLPTGHCPKANANEGLTFQLFSRGCSRCVHIWGLISSHFWWHYHSLSEVSGAFLLFYFGHLIAHSGGQFSLIWFSIMNNLRIACSLAVFQSYKPEDCTVAGIIARDGFLGLYRGFVPNVLKNLPNSRYDMFLRFARGIVLRTLFSFVCIVVCSMCKD